MCYQAKPRTKVRRGFGKGDSEIEGKKEATARQTGASCSAGPVQLVNGGSGSSFKGGAIGIFTVPLCVALAFGRRNLHLSQPGGSVAREEDDSSRGAELPRGC